MSRVVCSAWYWRLFTLCFGLFGSGFDGCLLCWFFVFMFVFFFSSRRRHTRSLCDWSSDVCSSDLDNGQLVAAVMNAPLMAQDHLQTSPGSRAEVQLDYGNLIRLAPDTDVGFADLEYHRYQVQLGAGTIVYRVFRNSNAQTEIDTPSIAIRPVGLGEYRISMLDNGTTQITVRSGEVEIFSPRGSHTLAAGHTVLVRGNPSAPELRQA